MEKIGKFHILGEPSVTLLWQHAWSQVAIQPHHLILVSAAALFHKYPANTLKFKQTTSNLCHRKE
jgi:hypothetical protein